MPQVVRDAHEKAVELFDEWFRYAESIGQQRLGSFLFAASILLAAFATLYAQKITLLSVFLCLFGVIFSVMWIYKGTRQAKFHKVMENEADGYLEKLRMTGGDPAQFPMYHIIQMKRHPERYSKKTRLHYLEQLFATRKFLYQVPALFCILNLICLMFAARSLFE